MKVAIVGTGFAGFGAMAALVSEQNVDIEVFDIGLIAKLPDQLNKTVPNAKTHLGSYFTYGVNDNRWSVGLNSRRICSSHALGGHSTVYSGAILYPKDQDLAEWPEESRPSAHDYGAVLSHFDVLCADDELKHEFPVAPTDEALQTKYSGQCMALLGLSRIALAKNFEGHSPNAKIFCTAAYFNELVQQGRIAYRSPVYVTRVEKIGDKARLLLENHERLQEWSDEFDAVFLAAGCINTTGIVDRSLFGVGTREYQIKSPVGLITAFCRLGFSLEEGQRMRRQANLPEFFLESNSSSTSDTWTHTQITAINEQIITAISSKIPFFKGVFADLFRNAIYFALTTAHSRFGKPTSLKASTTQSHGGILEYSICVNELNQSSDIPQIRSALFQAVRKHWRRLRMVPIPFGSQIADFFRGNKLGGWHFGGTLPMHQSPKIAQCHPSGEVAGLEGVYVVDSSAFPEISGSTVALLISANSHRVARQWRMKTQQKDKEIQCQ
jgi:hypothetical protein